MTKKKGCLNSNCPANQKHKMYETAYIRCPMCGEMLSYVCKDCYMKLPDGGSVRCIRCREKRKEHRKELTEKVTTGACVVVAAVSTATVAIMKKTPDIIKKIISK